LDSDPLGSPNFPNDSADALARLALAKERPKLGSFFHRVQIAVMLDTTRPHATDAARSVEDAVARVMSRALARRPAA